jgi:hypothetical protein
LDNARDEEQVRPLLPGTSSSVVVATSRNRLAGLVAAEGAHSVTLNPLTPIEAREMLTNRLGSARLTTEPRAVIDIIDRCARLPLALAVAAARAVTHPELSLTTLAEQLPAPGQRTEVSAVLDGSDTATNVGWSPPGRTGCSARPPPRLVAAPFRRWQVRTRRHP